MCCPPVQQRHEIAQGVLKIHGLVKKDHGIYECVVSSFQLPLVGYKRAKCNSAARTRFLKIINTQNGPIQAFIRM